MSTPKANREVPEIPQQIIKRFLEQLTAEEVSADIVARLQETLLDSGDISETAIKAALTGKKETL